MATPQRAPVPVLCVGNIVAGGAGKTPIALAMANILQKHGRRPHFLSRGYGGRAIRVTPLRVDPARHTANAVGDEPLLLARQAPCWVTSDRLAAARAAALAGADCAIMDDGLQHPHLVKDLSLLVIDGAYGLGNGRLLPAGPLRESWGSALAKSDAVVLNGEDLHGIAARLPAGLPLFRGGLTPHEMPVTLREAPLVAFAGIGRPERFFALLKAQGCQLAAEYVFGDHASYRLRDIARLREAAQKLNARLVTTEKDWVRLPEPFRYEVLTLPVRFVFEEAERFAAWLQERLP